MQLDSEILAFRTTWSSALAVSEFMRGLAGKVRLHGLRHSHASHLLPPTS